jgi:hypothetical protein
MKTVIPPIMIMSHRRLDCNFAATLPIQHLDWLITLAGWQHTPTTNCGSDAYIMLPFTCQIRSYLDPAAAPMHLMIYKDRGSVIDQPATAAAGRFRAWRGLVCLCSSLLWHYEVPGPLDSVTRASASSSSLMILSDPGNRAFGGPMDSAVPLCPPPQIKPC